MSTQSESTPTTQSTVPAHIAIIMDGNGRWAKAQGLPRLMGHQAGVDAVRRVVEACAHRGVRYLTIYSFSTENWSRSADEVRGLMSLAKLQLAVQRRGLAENNVRFKHLGRREGLPAEVLSELDLTVAATAHCTGLTLSAAVNYGSRQEIVDAVRSIAREVKDGTLNPDGIDEAMIAARLCTADMPDPDLVIRTAGEMRLSNYLLWQSSYAEFIALPVLWPDFNEDHLSRAIADYQKRTRTFGGRA
ncbi:MAG: isoprenyl transferase [Planctomycetota bacterium]|nr:isoprenyl transferase [Planctomycetota bacterium]